MGQDWPAEHAGCCSTSDDAIHYHILIVSFSCTFVDAHPGTVY